MSPNPPFSDRPPTAHAGRLIASCLQAFLPPERISTADYAAEHRFLANEGGGYVGRWNHDKAPYLVEIMEALDSQDHTTVALVKPGQCGGTASAENWLLKMVATDPADTLWYMQTDAAIAAYVKQTINPMIRAHPMLASRLGTRRTDDSLSYKGFLGMSAQFLAASKTNLVNKRAGRIVGDEWDAYDLEGADPKTLMDVRRQTYGRESMLFALSHPDRAKGLSPKHWSAGIMALYADSDRRTWWWQCPECGCWSSPNPNATRHMALEYNAEAPLDEIAEMTRLACPVHGCLIEDRARHGMNLTARWIGRGETIDEDGVVTGALARHDIAGFWIVGTMSPFIFGGIGGLARARVKAEREYQATGEDETIRQVVVKQWGYPYDPPKQIGSLDAAVIAERADAGLVMGQLPLGVRFITCGIDVQINRFELLFRGWGVERESWVLAHEVRHATPATDGRDWDDLFEYAASRTFPLPDGSGRVMRVRGVGCDSAGSPGFTPQAYAAWSRLKHKKAVKLIGNISGRNAWSLLLLKGGTQINAPNLQIILPDSTRKDRKAAARGQVPVGLFNPNWFKDLVTAQLGQAAPGPGYIHFPAALLSPEPPHKFFEQLVAEERRPNGSWVKLTARNEALDLMVMSSVIGHLFAPSRFDWTRPPPWARDWDQNPLVVTPTEAEPQALPTPPRDAPAAYPPPAPAPASPLPGGRQGRPPEAPARLTLRQMLASRDSGAQPLHSQP